MKQYVKKGQVTLFIIIGLIVLITVAGIFFLKKISTEAKLGIALEQDSAEGEAAVVQAFVSKCLEDTAKESVVLLGQQGGYINLSRTDIHNQQFALADDTTDSTSSDAVSFGPLHIPYWWYEDSVHGCTRCSITTKNIPTINIMEEQINAYVTEKIGICLNNFEQMEAMGFTIFAAEKPSVTSAIADKNVYVQLIYPLTISKEASASKLENWYVELNVPLENIYNAANEIVAMEIRNQFLEQITLNIISAYSGLDEERLPPIAAFTEGYAVIYWMKQTVKEQLGKYLKTYIPLIQIQGTTGAVQLEGTNEYGTGFFSMLFREINSESNYFFSDIAVNFISPLTEYTDYYLDITPRTGELLMPVSYKQEFGISFIPPIQTNHYSFYYDISYPVVVSLQDTSAFDGEGYTFFFAIEGNIRDNRNLMEWSQGTGTYGPWDASKVTISLKEGVPTTYPSGFDTETNQTIYSTYEEPEKTLICNARQRLSGAISVSAYNGLTGEPIPSAAVAFRCGIYQTCLIGTTDTKGSYEGSFPVCIGGAVRIDAEGYYTTFIDMDTRPEQENKVIALLEPLKDIPVTVKFIPSARLNESLSTTALRNLAFDMDISDNVLLTIEKIPENLFEQPYSQVLSISKNEAVNATLVSGTYNVNALLMEQEGLLIPARNETIAGQLIEYPEVNMTPALLGQVILDEITGQWKINAEELHEAEGITFFIFRINEPHTIEELGELGNLGNYSAVYRDVVEPSFEEKVLK